MTLRDIVARVNEWAAWSVRLDSSGLGYPSSTAEARTNGGGKRPPGPIVPNLVMNRWAVEVDRAMRNMPADMREIVKARHLGQGSERDKMAAWCAKYNVGRTRYYETLDQAYWFIGGWLHSHKSADRA